MNFVQLIAVAGTMASILGVFLAAHARYNNRLVKEESRHTREILTRIEQGQEETRKEVAEARKEGAEARREMAEAFRKIDEGHRETIKYLADLIRSEGDRTRQAIPGMSG